MMFVMELLKKKAAARCGRPTDSNMESLNLKVLLHEEK